ncbi:MAG: dienelactone hydrolase family protein [Burkholderiales bacterium]|nr:dienelactone hydrolase family protein [Burkholderiales bacterium]
MRITTRTYTMERDGISGFLAAPPGAGPRPGVLFIHHASGITAEIHLYAEDLARRGYAAFAVNMFHMLGAKGHDQHALGAQMQKDHEDAAFLRVIGEGWRFLLSQPGVDRSRTGAIGYCMGGRLAIPFAADTPALRAIVCNYPSIRDEQPSEHRPRLGFDTVKELKCATLVFWGGRDAISPPAMQLRVMAGLMGNGAPLEYHFYHDAAHGFFSPDGENHNADVAHRAWPITVDFLERYVDAPPAA